jgi:ribosomal protein S21
MGSKRPVNVSVKMGGRIRTIDQLIRKFSRLCKDEKIVEEVKERSYYQTKSQKKRKKRAAAVRRHKRDQKSQLNPSRDRKKGPDKRNKRRG